MALIPLIARQFTRPLSIISSTCCLALSSATIANPENARVVDGAAEFAQHGPEFVVQQHSQHVLIDYDSFNIAKGESVVFQQPNQQSLAVNRITGSEASSIFGNLSANGQIFLINQNGVLFAPGANINVGSLGVSTLNLEHFDRDTGRLSLQGDSTAPIINQGHIVAEGEHAYVALLGPHISNQGVIHSDGGIQLIADHQQLVFIAGDTTGLAAQQNELLSIENQGQIEGHQILLSANTKQAMTNSVINNEGIIHAGELKEVNGELRLVAHGGDVLNSGILSTSDESAGDINIQARAFASSGQLNADALGEGNAGQIHVETTNTLVLSSDSHSSANAANNGDGGVLRFYSHENALFAQGSTISALGGEQSGNGGFIEVSGLQHVTIAGLADTRARHHTGQQGLFYIDPADIIISASLDSNGTFSATNPISWTPSAASSIINVSTLNSQLALSNVDIDTANAGFAANGDITINDPIDINGAGSNTLTLRANQDIIFASPDAMLAISGGAILDSDLSSIENSQITLISGRNMVMQPGSDIAIDNSDLSMQAAATLTLTDVGFSSVGDIDLSATHLRNTSGTAVAINSSQASSQLNLNLSNPSASTNLALNPNISRIDFTIGAASNRIITLIPTAPLEFINIDAPNTDLFVNSPSNDIRINQLTSLANLRLTMSGAIATIPSTGLAVSNNLNINAADIVDTDAGAQAREIILSAPNASIKYASPTEDAIIHSTFDTARFEFVGRADLSIHNTGDLHIVDSILNNPANALAINVANGNLNLEVLGNLTLQDTIRATDLDADGIRKGLINITTIDGNIQIGDALNNRPTQILSTSPDATADGGLGISPSNQTAIRISNRPSSAGIYSVDVGNGTNTANIFAQGGDILLESTAVLNINNNAFVSAYSSTAGSTGGTIDNNATTSIPANISAETNRQIQLEQNVPIGAFPLPTPAPTPAPEEEPFREQAYIIQEELAKEIDDNQAASETTEAPSAPAKHSDLSHIFNARLANCQSPNDQQTQQRCEQVSLLKQFLGLLWINGDLPEASN